MKPVLKLKGKKLTVTMPAFGPGLVYEVSMTQILPKKVKVKGKFKIKKVAKVTTKRITSVKLTLTVDPTVGGVVVYRVIRGEGAQLSEQTSVSAKASFKVAKKK